MDYIDPVMNVHYPPNWIDLPTDPQIANQQWFEAFIRADSPPDVPAKLVRAVATRAASLVKNCAANDPDVIIAYWPDLLDVPPAMCEISGFPVNADDDPAQLSEVAKGWRQKTKNTVGDISVEFRTLPAGPAVRMRRMNIVRGGRRGDMIVERVIWAVCPPGMNMTIFINVSWKGFARGETFAAQADLMADQFRIIEASEGALPVEQEPLGESRTNKADPAAVYERIRAETGIDLLDPASAKAAGSAVLRRSIRQYWGAVGSGLMSATVVLSMVMAFASWEAGKGPIIAYLIGGVAAAPCAVALSVWGKRIPRAYRDTYLPQQVVARRFLAEIGRPWNPLGVTDAGGREILLNASSPFERQELLVAEAVAELERAARDSAEDGAVPG